MTTLNTNVNEEMSEDELLASMIGEIVESDEHYVAPDEHVIEAAVAEIEKAEARQAIYEEQDAEGEEKTAEADKPKTKAGKAGKEPKPKAPPRVTYASNKASDVLAAKLGDKVGEMLLLEVNDVTLDPDALAEKQRELLAILNVRPNHDAAKDGGPSTQKKVAEKVVMLFSWINKGGTLNEVMRRTFEVLVRDGEITSGDKGNLHAALLAKPYSIGTCRAQAGQMMSMLPMLKIATKSEKGKLVANPDSLILMKVKEELGLS